MVHKYIAGKPYFNAYSPDPSTIVVIFKTAWEKLIIQKAYLFYQVAGKQYAEECYIRFYQVTFPGLIPFLGKSIYSIECKGRNYFGLGIDAFTKFQLIIYGHALLTIGFVGNCTYNFARLFNQSVQPIIRYDHIAV